MCNRLLGRAQFKPWGIKKELCSIYDWVCTYQCFGFKVGLFTLMKIDSLMVLSCPWSSLPMMLKLVSVIVYPVCCMCAWLGEGCLRCSLLLSPRVLAVSPMYSSSQAIWLHWKLYITLLFISFGSWFLGFMRACFMIVLPLKWTCIPYLPQTCLILSTIPLVYGMTTCPTVDFFLGVVGSGLLPWLLLFCVWLLLLPPL